MLEDGSFAPTFTVPDQHGQRFSLTERRGGWVLLWWYPKADTPG